MLASKLELAVWKESLERALLSSQDAAQQRRAMAHVVEQRLIVDKALICFGPQRLECGVPKRRVRDEPVSVPA